MTLSTKSDGDALTAAEYNELKAAVGVTDGFVSVKNFGALGDGVTDDTVAIQAAIDSVAGSSGTGGDDQQGVGGVVFFPPGKYRITSLNLNNTDRNQNIELRGSGPLATSLQWIGASGDIITVTGTTGDSIHGFTMRDIGIQANSASGVALKLTKTIRQVLLERVYIRNPGSHGIHITDVSNMVTIKDCRIHRDDSPTYTALAGYGIRCDFNAEQIWLYGNSIRGFQVGLSVLDFNNVVSVYGGDIASNVIGCLIQGGSASDSQATACVLTGIYFEDNGEDVKLDCVTAGFEAAGILIFGNSFSGTTGSDQAYGDGVAKSEAYCINVKKAKDCHFGLNEFRKVISANVTACIGVTSASAADIRIDQQLFQASTTRPHFSILSGTNIYGHITESDNRVWTYKGTAKFDGAVRTLGELQVEGLVSVKNPAELSLASDAFVPVQTFHRLASESGTADELKFIDTPTNPGVILYLRATAGHTITVKDAAMGAPAGYAQLRLNGDFAMTEDSVLVLLYDSVAVAWIEVSRSAF